MTATAELETREFVNEQEAISWQDILDACELKEDTDMGAPWDEHDGWEHELKSDTSDGMAAGYIGRGKMVVLTEADSWGNFDYFRGQGASKQVARELTAYIQRQAVEQIAEWHRNGFEWWGVVCDLEGCHTSCWGIDDKQYAWHEVRLEIAREMAGELEKKGFFVYGVPDRKEGGNHAANFLRYKLANKKDNGANAFNWKGEVERRRRA